MKTRLELAAVTKRFGALPVLAQAWLQVRAGEAVGLVGANGAGKTTLLRIAAGLVIPDGGVVRTLESPAGTCYFGGESTLPREVRGRRWAGLFGVSSQERRRLGALSRGSRQLYGLRIALATYTDLLILDEPWEGLDPSGAAWLTDALQRRRDMGAALLVSSHRLHDLVEVCSRFLLLEGGRCRAITDRDDRPRAEQLAQAVRVVERA
ncbi:MAG TPA: ATP-binding cassette domain-containing protein [Vicinamibacterales bacterium]|nr:ATP-binding cassette domain-containing protein [Vicinamibacterales bacterium]